ncbi:MAG: cupin domain-containing protein [Euryarchaeota archaeon]|nr:cupin domain-containing protein [Euryarchaeota archaeon]
MIENYLDLERGIMEHWNSKVVRKASDMRGFYLANDALEKMIEGGDPVIYEVYAVTHENEGELCYGVTVLHPGKVGDEFFMTKGHYHEKRDRGELYIGLRGRGLLLMQKDEEVQWYEMRRGTVIYVPPYWAHRSINTGTEDFVFLAIYPGDAGHDYGTIAEKGFAKIVVEKEGRVDIIKNPRY